MPLPSIEAVNRVANGSLAMSDLHNVTGFGVKLDNKLAEIVFGNARASDNDKPYPVIRTLDCRLSLRSCTWPVIAAAIQSAFNRGESAEFFTYAGGGMRPAGME